MPSDAYTVFEKLTELQLISANSTKEWKQIIGLRNAIVHDYINIDKSVINAVITEKKYIGLQSFAVEISNKLKQDGIKLSS